MIVREENGIVIIYQTDHAKLSGKLAENWGNSQFAKPDPLESVVFAANHHDDGWAMWEAHPTINPETGFPTNFNEIPVDEHFKMYSLGIERVSSDDCYSGALVAMHARRLYEWKKERAANLKTKDAEIDPASVIEEAFNWLDSNKRYNIYRMIGDEYEYATNESYIRANFELLLAWDAISLYLCGDSTDEYTIERVPTDYRGNTVSMTLKKESDGHVICSSYPFAKQPLEVEIPSRKLTKTKFKSDEELRSTIKDTEITTMRFTLDS